MEAKETVMTTSDIKKQFRERPHDKEAGETFVEWLCIAQAEISFKAGCQEGWDRVKEELETNPEILRIAREELEEAKQAGRREVVEAIKIYDKNYARHDWGDLQFRDSILWWLNSKLKEWGL